MAETMISVGVDLGTSTTQLIFSKLTLANTAPAFTVPRMEILHREILYRSAIHLTPLLGTDTLDAEAIAAILTEEYRLAGMRPETVQTGAVVITGETARKENARAVLEAISHLAGEFVVATAGPALESVLAARGAGAESLAKSMGKRLLHLDIGGGTTNLALLDAEGRIVQTGCLNVGGRLVKLNPDGVVTYVSPTLFGLDTPAVGERATPESLAPLLAQLVAALEEAVGLRPATALLRDRITDQTISTQPPVEALSFSGGVAALLDEKEENWLAYGDLGVLLARAIAASRLFTLPHDLGRETIRATVVGAGNYATELSGSTIFHRHAVFPLHDLPVAPLEKENLADGIRQGLALHGYDVPIALALPRQEALDYDGLTRLAETIADGAKGQGREVPLVVVLEQDMAKALGQALATLVPPEKPLICLDGLYTPPGSYLDLAAPVGSGTALPVVIKTLAFV